MPDGAQCESRGVSELRPAQWCEVGCGDGCQFMTVNVDGSIQGLGSPLRCFTSAQPRAIPARDGGCVIPGYAIPAAWCEIHHVDPAESDGPTRTDNGTSPKYDRFCK